MNNPVLPTHIFEPGDYAIMTLDSKNTYLVRVVNYMPVEDSYAGKGSSFYKVVAQEVITLAYPASRLTKLPRSLRVQAWKLGPLNRVAVAREMAR